MLLIDIRFCCRKLSKEKIFFKAIKRSGYGATADLLIGGADVNLSINLTYIQNNFGQ
jgi:hypothetical protein